MQNQAQILNSLLNTLRFSQFDLTSVRGREPQTAISLSLDDLYLADEPIAMRARVITTPGKPTGKLKAEIASVWGDRPVLQRDFEEQQHEWVLTTDLQSGLYRLTVYAENSSAQDPTPVHDVFEVVKK